VSTSTGVIRAIFGQSIQGNPVVHDEISKEVTDITTFTFTCADKILSFMVPPS
jgi:hypothetical protein